MSESLKNEQAVVVKEDGGQEIITKVVGSKTVSSTKKVMKTTTKSSSSSSSSSKKTTTSSSSSSSSQQQSVSETSKSESSHSSSSTSSHNTEVSSSTTKRNLLIHSSNDSYLQAAPLDKPALQILLPSNQSTPTTLSPEDFSPRAGWMGEISFDVALFDKTSISVQSDGFNIEVRAAKASVDDQGSQSKEEYAKVCRLPEVSIDPAEMSSSLFEDGVMTILVPVGKGECIAQCVNESVGEVECIKQCVGESEDKVDCIVQCVSESDAKVEAKAEEIKKDEKDFILTSGGADVKVTAAPTTLPFTEEYNKEYSQATKTMVVKKDGQSFSHIQISKSGEVAAHVSNPTALLPASEQAGALQQAEDTMHFSVAGFEGESIEVCSDGKKVEVKAIRISKDEQGNERKDEFSRSYELPALIDPGQLRPILSQDGVLSVQVDSLDGGAVGGVKEGMDGEEVGMEVVRKQETKQAREIEGGREEFLSQKESIDKQLHSQSQSADGTSKSSTSMKSSSSSSSSFSSSSTKVTSHQVLPATPAP